MCGGVGACVRRWGPVDVVGQALVASRPATDERHVDHGTRARRHRCAGSARYAGPSVPPRLRSVGLRDRDCTPTRPPGAPRNCHTHHRAFLRYQAPAMHVRNMRCRHRAPCPARPRSCELANGRDAIGRRQPSRNARWATQYPAGRAARTDGRDRTYAVRGAPRRRSHRAGSTRLAPRSACDAGRAAGIKARAGTAGEPQDIREPPLSLLRTPSFSPAPRHHKMAFTSLIALVALAAAVAAAPAKPKATCADGTQVNNAACCAFVPVRARLGLRGARVLTLRFASSRRTSRTTCSSGTAARTPTRPSV